MKTLIILTLTAIAALGLAGCGNMPANNANAGNASNANANKAATTAPTAETLMALETKAFEAWKNKDGKYFETFLADNYVGTEEGKVKTKAEEIKGIAESKCDIKSFSLADPKVTPVGPDAAVLTVTATADGTCEGQKIPSPVTSATLFVRSGDTWKAANHNEVPIKAPPAPADANANKPASNTNSTAPKPAATATPKPAATATPKPATPAPTATPASNTAATTSSPSNTTTASNSNSSSSEDVTNKVFSLEKMGWDAWKSRDSDKLNVMVTDNVTFVDANGQVAHGKDATMKMWMGPKCDIKSVNLSDPKVVSVLANVAVLTFKGGAKGECEGQPLSTLWGTSIYYKDGEAWKLAYGFEVPAKS